MELQVEKDWGLAEEKFYLSFRSVSCTFLPSSNSPETNGPETIQLYLASDKHLPSEGGRGRAGPVRVPDTLPLHQVPEALRAPLLGRLEKGRSRPCHSSRKKAQPFNPL